MKYFYRITILGLLFGTLNGFAQTKGLIYNPAGNSLGKSVLDPNGDGFTSPTIAGFAGTDYGTGSELNMVALPVITTEPVNDLTTGPAGGFTDLVSNASFRSCYILTKNVGGINYLIVRFRLGKNSTAPKGYSLLLDTDGNSNNNYSASNPCFEKEIALQAGVAVKINTLGNGVLSALTYSVDNYHQRSVALTNFSGDPDYFYDFFVPLADIGVSLTNVRMVATTVINGQSAITGTGSDLNGVNDSTYGGNTALMFKDVVSTFPTVNLGTITSGSSFSTVLSFVPSITSTINTASNTITGVSQEPIDTVIKVYQNGVYLGETKVNATNGWTLTGVSGLVAGNLITATATASGKAESLASAAITVTAVPSCYTPAPTTLVRGNQQTITGVYAHANGGAIAANTVRIRLWSETNNGLAITFSEIDAALTVNVATDGTWSFVTTLTNTNFNNTNILATATFNSCVSGYSTINIKTNGPSGIGIVSATPTILTTPILASPTLARSVQVTNNGLSASTYLMLYVNGIQVAISPVIASGGSHTFSYTGFVEGDIVTARAQSTVANYWLSNPSNSVIVTLPPNPTIAPVITGTYIAGSVKTVTGTSSEGIGTVINLYKGTTFLGTTTVGASGTWSISNLTLAGGDVLTATAKTNGKTISASSTSVTVSASAPAVPIAPTVTGPSINAGATSISGTGGLNPGTVTVYADGVVIGTVATTTGAWTLSGTALDTYKGAVITATNTNSTGGVSLSSTGVTVVGVGGFCITDTSGAALTDKKSGESFNVKITAMTGPGCSGTEFTGFTGTVVVSSSTNFLSGGGETLNFVAGVLTSYTMVLGTNGTGVTISAFNTEDPTASGTTSFNVPSSVWTGTTSTNFGTTTNWSGSFVPLAGADISIPVVTNAPVLTTAVNVGNLNIATGTTLGLGGQTLTVSGGFAGTGTLVGGGNSSVVVNGAGSSGTLYINQTTLGTSNALKDFTVNKDVLASSVTLGNELNLTGTLTLTKGTINTGGYLVLKSSSATATAVVAPIVDCNGVAISGEVMVEKFIPARRAFRLLTSPVTTTTFIRDNWQEGVNNTVTAYSGNQNPMPGYGTHITGVLANSQGFDLTQTTNNSMFAFNNATGAWVAVANTNATTLAAGVPYRLMVRGDRSIDLNTNTPTPTNTILRSKGTLKICDAPSVTLSTAAEGFSFVGNPYQAVVNIKQSLIAGTNLNSSFYWAWDPTLSTRGAYVTFDLDTNTPNVSSLVNQYLQPGQACFVKNTVSGNGAITFKENQKASAAVNGAISRMAAPTASYIKLNLYECGALASQASAADGLIVKFGSNFTNEVDATDADKFTNLDENFATNNSGKLLSIESRAMPQSTDEIALHINQYRNLNYSIVAQQTNLDGSTPYLYDQYTQKYTEIPASGLATYNYAVVASDAQSIASTRFKIVFTNSSLGTDSKEFSLTPDLFPNPAKEGCFTINSAIGVQSMEVEVYNALGQKIDFSVSNSSAYTQKIEILKPADKGVYLVRIKQNGNIVTKKLIIN